MTPTELFAYRLCRTLGIVHPDYLLSALTWKQYVGWQSCYEQEPWGESRDDERTMAQTMWIKAAIEFNRDALPDLHYPYFGEPIDVIAVKAALDTRAKEIMEKRQRERTAGG